MATTEITINERELLGRSTVTVRVERAGSHRLLFGIGKKLMIAGFWLMGFASATFEDNDEETDE